MASNAGFAFGTGAYTVEFWVYFISIAGTDSRIFDAGSASGSFGVSIDNTNAVNIAKYGTGYVVQTPARALPSNQWAHVAVVRDSTSTNATRIYINGSLAVTGTDNNNWTVTTTPSICGLDLSLYNPQCYLSNLRVVKGGSLYTSNFTPTTAPLSTTVSSGTVYLLTCQSNRFVDNSGTISSFTVTGTPSVQAFGPFAPALQWTPDVVGGSGYFDGTGDYLNLASNAAFGFGTGNFTVEFWIYPTSSANDKSIYHGTITDSFVINTDSTGKFLVRQYGVADLFTAATALTVNAWNHIAVSRSGTTISGWLNGSRTAGFNGTNSTNWATTALYIGSTDTGIRTVSGYISGLRTVKGTAVYDPTQSTITIPTLPPTAITNTSLLTNYTNAGIYDGKMANNLETAGSAQVATSPVKYGSGSMYFNGSGNYLVGANSVNLDFGSGDFTIEFWINTLQTTAAGIVGKRTSGGAANTNWIILINQVSVVGNVVFYASDGSTYQVSALGGGLINNGVWHHVAVTRANSTFRVFVDGTQVATSTWTGTIASTSRPVYVGTDDSGLAGPFTGYLDDLRITKGVARYFANFTPPQQALPRQ
jgi:hypothetical protein